MSYLRRIKNITANSSENFVSVIKEQGLVIFAKDFGFSDEDDAEAIEVKLHWSYSLDVRRYGIKSLTPYVPDQLLDIVFRIDGEDVLKKVEAKNIEVRGEREDQYDPSISLFPTRLECHHGVWTVVFVL